MATNPTLITTPFAQSGDKTTPPNTNTPSDGRFSQTLGFPPVTAIPLGSGGKAPKREDFNGAFNMLADLLFYAQKGWRFEWDSGQAYYKGCIVRYSGSLYECTSDVTSTTNPASDTAHWSKYKILPGVEYATKSDIAGSMPIGSIIAFAGSSTPTGFLFCDGSAVSRSTYADLFTAIGTTYGNGDGSTTFNLPDLSDNRFLEGATTLGIANAAGLPDITGTAVARYGVLTGERTGAFTESAAQNNNSAPTYGGSEPMQVLKFEASKSNSIYGNSTTVQPKSLSTRFIIRAQ